jgi:hypothetical protein
MRDMPTPVKVLDPVLGMRFYWQMEWEQRKMEKGDFNLYWLYDWEAFTKVLDRFCKSFPVEPFYQVLLLIYLFSQRYANMDYLAASILRHVHIALILIWSYDIVCQWVKKLVERLKKLPPLVRLNITLRVIRFVIPKLHILGHLIKCQEKFSLNFTLGAGQSDAEGIERLWSGLGGAATSLKEMGPGSHQDTLEDHIGNWNWQKVVGLGRCQDL